MKRQRMVEQDAITIKTNKNTLLSVLWCWGEGSTIKIFMVCASASKDRKEDIATS